MLWVWAFVRHNVPPRLYMIFSVSIDKSKTNIQKDAVNTSRLSLGREWDRKDTVVTEQK